MNEISKRALRIFHFTFIWMFAALTLGMIGFLADVVAIAWLAMAAFFLSFIVNMAALITLLLEK